MQSRGNVLCNMLRPLVTHRIILITIFVVVGTEKHRAAEAWCCNPSTSSRRYGYACEHCISTIERRHFTTALYAEQDKDSRIDHNNSTTIIAGHTFCVPTDEDLETIQHRQVHHPIQPKQVFCVSSNLCKYGHPQAFGFHPTAGPKLVSGLFRLSCPLLCQAIDEYENKESGVRQMSDWVRSKDRDRRDEWKREGYESANKAQKEIRMELAKDDMNKLASKMGEYNALRFIESGVAGIPANQTYNVKCVHAHVADHLCRCPSSSDTDTTKEGGNIIGEQALRVLEDRGVQIMGNDVCWQQCNGNREQLPSDWQYIPKKNRHKLRSTRIRRKDMLQKNDKCFDK